MNKFFTNRCCLRQYWLCLLQILLILICNVNSFPDQGKWDFLMHNQLQTIPVRKTLFNGSEIFVQIICVSDQTDTNVSIMWTIEEIPCWNEYYPDFSRSLRPKEIVRPCSGHIPLSASDFGLAARKVNKTKATKLFSNEPIFTITADGIYRFNITMHTNRNEDFSATVHIEMRGAYGFLSATDHPLLRFYEGMCLIYVLFGVIWLLVSFMQWRDLLRIQFWIGGVILLGMLEKAMFYAEYYSINVTGESMSGAILLAEWISCAKRTLARMLVIIVSLGFGIVKPRLGPMLHRVVGIGSLYFVLACVESYLRVMHTKNDPANQILVASIPLAVLDSAICWWIFTSLVQTTRTLRLRRNMVKLTLYRHFTNTLIFAVLASIIFMLFSIKVHQFERCLKDWKDLWQDEAFWHVLFSLLLLVIMILWRPSNNNQRYAFTPLLDSPEDEDEDEEEHFVSDIYGVKMRGTRSTSPKPQHLKPSNSTTEEDDLRWVEENIPTAIADATLPTLDSDEEIINTRFEVSKMQ